MKSIACLVISAAALFSSSATAANVDVGIAATPVEKVVELMKDMIVKGEAEKQSESVEYAAYKQFCDSTSAEKKQAIDEATARIAVLTAGREKAGVDADALATEIAAHQTELASLAKQQADATAVRTTEKADYEKSQTDLLESADAVQRAVTKLKEKSADRKQVAAESLVQLSALSTLTSMRKDDLASLSSAVSLAQGNAADDSSDISAPEANAYEFQSGGVIGMLEKLGEKFVKERRSSETDEQSKRNAYELLVQGLKASQEQTTKTSEQKTELRAAKLEAKASAVAEIKDLTATKEADTKYRDDLVAGCGKKAEDFAARAKMRADELTAIQQAVDIISGGAVAGNAKKHLTSLMQVKRTVLAHLRAETRSPGQEAVANFLMQRATELSSRALSAIAVQAGADPMNKVRKMISDLITKLQAEGSEEADHNAWCESEKETNGKTKTEKTDSVDKLTAETGELTAQIAKLAEEAAALKTSVAELDKALTKATTLRQNEKTNNTAAIKDAQEAQAAVKQATTVLKNFYGKAAEAKSLLLQQKADPNPKAPKVFDGAYKGMQSANGGIMGLLQVIESDFAKLEKDTKAAEAKAEADYKKFESDSKVDKMESDKDLAFKTAKSSELSQTLNTKKSDLDGSKQELAAAVAYAEKLKASCKGEEQSFEERSQKRTQEIQSLKEAVQMLTGGGAAL